MLKLIPETKYFKTILIALLISCSANVLAQTKVVHALVALCDNDQNIAPVAPKLGNGQDLTNNLYWGALYGLKTNFKNSADWQLVKSIRNPEAYILERVVFKHKQNDVYLVADAYDGDYIYTTVRDFIHRCAGEYQQQIQVDNKTLNIGGGADLLVYIGHNAMMDYYFNMDYYPAKSDHKQRQAIVLGCYSSKYFTIPLEQSSTQLLISTTGLMAPEAYILEAALDGWVRQQSNEEIRLKAAKAYAKYQRCPFNSANRLFVTSY